MRTLVLCSPLVLFLAASPAGAQCPPARLASPIAAAGDLFGESLALDGDLLLVGASQFGSPEGGYAIAFRRAGSAWVAEAELRPATPIFGQGFGFHLDLDQGSAIVSASCTSAACTSHVEFFERGLDGGGQPVWQRTAIQFVDVLRQSGNRVALSGDTAVASRGGDEVVVFRRKAGSWVQSQVIPPPPAHAGEFAESLELDGNLLVVSGAGRTYAYADAGGGFALDEELLSGGTGVGGAVGAARAQPFSHVAVADDDGVHLFVEELQPFPLEPIWVEVDQVAAPAGPFGFRTLALEPSNGFSRPLRVAVGDRFLAGTQQGVVWVFEDQGGLLLRQKVVQPETFFFGFDVVLDGDRLATGTWATDAQGKGSLSARFGSAWVAELSAALCPGGCTAPRLPDGGAPPGDERGSALAFLGSELALVGAPGDDAVATDAGAVHVYRRFGSCWSPQETLYASDASAGARFGESLSVEENGRWLLVGAPEADGGLADAGRAYVFEEVGGGTWLERAVLAPATEHAGGRFGAAVGVSFQHALVGEPGSAGATSDRVVVFQNVVGNWVETAALLPTAGGGGFGAAIDVEDLEVMIGAPGDDDAGPDAGAVYHFTVTPFGGWQRIEKVLAPDGSSADGFGSAVDLELGLGTARLAVGAPGARAAGLDDAGRAYLLAPTPFFTVAAALTADEPRPGERFGAALDLEGARLAVGAPGAAPSLAGRLHGFDVAVPGAPRSLGSLAGDGTGAGAGFGSALAVEGEDALVGAPGDLLATGSAWSHALDELRLAPGLVRRASAPLLR